MKKYFFLVPVIFILLLSSNLSAQENRRGGRWSRGHYDRDCVPLMDLNLSEEQRTAILVKEGSYREKMIVLRVDLIEKIVEFRRMLRDPDVGEKNILDGAKEIETVRAHIQKERLDHYLGIRRILSPEQIRNICPPLDRRFIRERERRP